MLKAIASLPSTLKDVFDALIYAFKIHTQRQLSEEERARMHREIANDPLIRAKIERAFERRREEKVERNLNG